MKSPHTAAALVTEVGASPRGVSTSRQCLAGIPEADRIPFNQKLAFAVGACTPFLAVDLTISAFWMPFFNIGLGISPLSLSAVLVVLRVWEAFGDPLVGNLSDNMRTRWGRRRPFMVGGAIFMAVFYLLLWHPPEGHNENVTLAYLCVIGLLFSTSCTFWNMPFYAMQMELTPNYDERTRLMAWTALFGKISGLLGGWAMAFVTGSWFINSATGKPDLVQGMQFFCWIVAGLILVFGLLPPLIGRERFYDKEVVRQTRDPFWASLKESFRNKPLWLLIGSSFFILLGTISVSSLGQYLNIYLVNEGDIAMASIVTGWKSTVLVATGIACIPLWTWLAEKFDKRSIVIAMVALSLFGHFSYLLCLRPDMPYLQLIPAVFEVGAVSAIWIFLPSMKADVADYDEARTNRRREGALNAFFSWFIKVASTLALGLGGGVLQITGFDARIQAQQPEVLQRMLLIFVILPLLLWPITLMFLWWYPLTRTRMAEIRRQLEVRRGKI